MSTNLSKLADELKPYFVPWVRKIAHGNGGGTGTGGTPDMLAHELASTSALGTFHTVSGLTAGQVLKATGATNAAFGQLLHSQLGGIGANDHHNQSHAYDSADHTGTLSWAKINFTGSSLGDLATRNYAQLNSRTHDIIGGDHSYTGGAALDVFGLSAASTLARITPSDSVSSAQTAILKATNGALSIDALTAAAKVRAPLLDTAGVAHMTVAPGGRLILSPAEWVQLTDGKTFRTESFSSGFVGNGMRLDQGVAEAGRTTIEVDNLWVRGRMHVYELLIHQIRASNGSIFVSNTGKVVDVSGSGPYTLTTDPEHGFAVGDLIRAQRFTGTGVYQCNMQVTSVTNTNVFVATLSSGDAPAAGMDFARLGSASDANRRGGLYLTADDSGAPFMDIFDGVSSFATWNTPGVIKSRLGKLDRLGLPGSYTGEYGFYAGNGTTDADAYVRLSNKTSRFNNVPLAMWSGGVQVGQWSSNGQLDIGFNGITTPADRDFTVHASGYVRIGRVGANMPNLLYTAGGDLQLRSNTTPVITLAGDGSSYFSGRMTIGVNGEISQWSTGGNGIRLWNDGGVGRIGGYTNSVMQWSAATDGKMYAGYSAGTPTVALDASGISIASAMHADSTIEPMPNDGWIPNESSDWYPMNMLRFKFAGYANDFVDLATYGYSNTDYSITSYLHHQRLATLRVVMPAKTGGSLAKLRLEANDTVVELLDIANPPSGFESRIGFLVNGTERMRALASGVKITGAMEATGAVSGTTGTFSDALTASNGELGMSIGAPYYGVSIRAPAGGWTRGFQFRNSADVDLGGFGAYGSGNTISWYWIGNAYNDCSIRTYPTTGNTEVTGTLAVASTVNAGGAYKRGGTDGYIFVPVSAFYMQDNNAVTWNGSAGRNIGTYVFNPQAANNGIPAGATAIAVAMGAKWTGSESDGKYMTAIGVGRGAGEIALTVRNVKANVTADGSAIVPVGTNDDFQVQIVGENAALVYVRCIGYFM